MNKDGIEEKNLPLNDGQTPSLEETPYSDLNEENLLEVNGETRREARPLSQYILGDSYHLTSESETSRSVGEFAVQTDKERIENISGTNSISMSLSEANAIPSTSPTPKDSEETEGWEGLKSTSGRIEYPFYDSDDDFPFSPLPAQKNPKTSGKDSEAASSPSDSSDVAVHLSLTRKSVTLSREESVPRLDSPPQESIPTPAAPPLVFPLHPQIAFFSLSFEDETPPPFLCDQTAVGNFPIFRRYLSLLADRDKMSKLCH